MPACYWVLDTMLLHHAAELGRVTADRVRSKAALDVLFAVSKAHRLAVDARNRIHREYSNAWKEMLRNPSKYPSYPTAHSFWSDVWQKGPHRSEKSVPTALRALLEAANIKDDSDMAFVEAANATNDKLLATEDSDYTEEIRAALRATADVNVKALRYPEAARVALPAVIEEAAG